MKLLINFYWQVINLCQKCIYDSLGFLIVPVVYLQKKEKRIKKFVQTENTDFIYRNELDKACFQYDMAYGKRKDLKKELNQIKY